MNSHAVTGKSDRCPECGSENVRWRNRRWYDAVINNVRGFIDWGLGSLFRTRPRPRSTVLGTDRDDQFDLAATKYDVYREQYDYKMAFMSPSRYWACRDCRKSGEEYQDAHQALELEAHAIALQDELTALDPAADISFPVDEKRRTD